MKKRKDNQFKPNYAILPGKTLLETIESIGMSQAELARRMGRPFKTISEIINGKNGITPDTALELERVLGVPATFWINLENNYKENLARIKEGTLFESLIGWVNEFPIKDMIKFGWIPECSMPQDIVRNLLSFFSVAGSKQWKKIWTQPKVAYRKSNAFNSNPYAVSAWLRRGQLLAQNVETSNFDKKIFKEALLKIRALTLQSDPNIFIPNLKELCANAGVVVLFVPEVSGTKLFGATRWLSPKKAIIQLSLRRKTDDHLWFTFFHESAHILKHGTKERFIDTDEEFSGDSEKEVDANKFACEYLISPDDYYHFVRMGSFKEQNILNFSNEIGISQGIIVGRLQREGHLTYRTRLNKLKQFYEFVINK